MTDQPTPETPEVDKAAARAEYETTAKNIQQVFADACRPAVIARRAAEAAARDAYLEAVAPFMATRDTDMAAAMETYKTVTRPDGVVLRG